MIVPNLEREYLAFVRAFLFYQADCDEHRADGPAWDAHAAILARIPDTKPS
jgi:hypothetical protein